MEILIALLLWNTVKQTVIGLYEMVAVPKHYATTKAYYMPAQVKTYHSNPYVSFGPGPSVAQVIVKKDPNRTDMQTGREKYIENGNWADAMGPDFGGGESC